MVKIATRSEPVLIDRHSQYRDLDNFINKGRVLVLTSQSVSKLPSFIQFCSNFLSSDLFVVKDVKPNPTPELLDNLFCDVREFEPKTIVAFGGGSVIDSGKILKARFANEHAASTLRLLELDELSQDQTILVAVPTTAGTGSEVTQFATLWTGKRGGKESLESFTIKPSVVVLDASCIPAASKVQILNSGLDAISHCVETIWNRSKTEQSQEYAVLGLQKILDALPRVLRNDYVMGDCENLQNGALFAGKAISINQTAIAHSISYPLTAYLGVPHGLACSFTIPAIYKHLYAKTPNATDTKKILEESVAFLESLNLPDLVLSYGRFDRVVEVGASVSTKSRTKNFCVDSDGFEVRDLLAKALANK